MNVWTSTLLSVAAVSLLSLAGVLTLTIRREYLNKILILFVGFAVGALFGDAFIHLIPESFEAARETGGGLRVSLLILLGILIFFVMEKGIRLRDCIGDKCEGHPKPFVTIVLVGDTFHNFIDGMVIAASYGVDFHLGITTTVAVVMHELPHEIGDFSALLHGGLSVKRALLYNFLSALAAVLGAVVSLGIGNISDAYTQALPPITAGGFIYLAGSDLLPELYADNGVVKSFLQLACIVVGIGMMTALILVGE